jgi:adenylate cyclase
VRYVVVGSVRKSGSRVRIAAQLVDATTGQHIWSSTYDRELTDVFAVQDEISEAIASPLVSDLQRAEHERAQRRAPESLEAWGLYQRALPLIHRFTPEDSRRAREYLERAVALDPQFATALARLAEARLWDVLNLWTETPDETLAQALAASRRAAALDPRDAEAQAILALVLLTTGDSAGSREASRRALDLNPSLPMALTFYAYFLHMTGGSPDESVAMVHRAMKLSPRDPIEWVFYDVLGCAYWNGGRYDEGLAASERLLALVPSYYFGYVWAAINQIGLGRAAEARDVIRKARLVQPSLSIELVRKSLGALAPDVDRRLADALRAAGLPETAAPGA